MRKLLTPANILFLLLLGLVIIPVGRLSPDSRYLIGLVVLIEVFYVSFFLLRPESEKSRTAGDITALVFFLITLWQLFTGKLDVLDKMLFPTPGAVIALFVTDLPTLLQGLISSLKLLLTGYFLALAAAVPLALFIGWRKRFYNAIKPITKILGPIPPIVYIPYAIGLLPTFTASSVFIIFIGAFWPIFINTLNGVSNVEKRIVDSARALNVSEKTMLFKVILPATLPSIVSGSTIGLVLAFILLTAAEMIGATSGLGWYVKYFSDFADYPRVIVGIVFIGIVVTGITLVFERVEKYLLRWKA